MKIKRILASILLAPLPLGACALTNLAEVTSGSSDGGKRYWLRPAALAS